MFAEKMLSTCWAGVKDVLVANGTASYKIRLNKNLIAKKPEV